MNTGATTFTDALADIVSNVKDDEYMVLMCTFAQGSATRESTSWMQAISDACNKKDITEKIYDASSITPKTVIGDVLGNVIVVVCLEDAIEAGTNLPSESKCLFAHAPLTLTSDMFNGTTPYQSVPLLYSSKKNSGITLFCTQAQICGNKSSMTSTERGYGPSISERKNIGENILNCSKTNYGNVNYFSSNWLYLGIGGYYATNNYGGVAEDMNNWINDRVTSMGTSSDNNYYPVGIVLMNQVKNYQNVVKNILNLNNKYRLQINPDWEPKPTGQSEVRSAAPGYSSGAVDNNTNAINWE